jgi:hypothetical protein
MWENYDYDDDDMEMYEIECLREEARLEIWEPEEFGTVQYWLNKYGIKIEIEI